MESSKTPRNQSRGKIIDAAVFAVLLALVSAVTFVLFYRQTWGSPETGYHSDMKAYILEIQGLNQKYHFPYPVFFWLAAFLHLFTTPECAVALATMLLNSLGIVFVKLALNRVILPECEENGLWMLRKDWQIRVLLSFLAVSLFFISMLYPPPGIYLPGIKFKYLGVFTANPFHNATYLAARPFAILAFFWFAKLLPTYERGVCLKPADGAADKPAAADYIWFSASLLLATMTKPSFTLVLAATAGLIMLFRLFRSRFRNFVPTVQLGLCFAPTFLDLLYQYRDVFTAREGQEGGVGFCFGEVWGYYCDNIPLAVCLAVGFPLLTLVFNLGEWKRDARFRLSWQIYLMSFVMAFFLYEKGFRKPDFNFSWGYEYGIFFCHLGALLVLLRATARKANKWILGIQWLAYLAHVVCGLFYFADFMSGKMYY